MNGRAEQQLLANSKREKGDLTRAVGLRGGAAGDRASRKEQRESGVPQAEA